ncbi:GntR family transcriptional regulator [Curvibacter sp. RS43]|uniref:GntR family transcriptional regulator n=1 Tax=Curvibacter microcysteis TaxID=3026419 RepID=UPI0023607577|nr:GntR family transcriptional regulator [Curvibacter sp. RS43]MDD0809099.1 GntR family transcriptional regulator [Curvibacter sp. RS43]
MQPFQPLNPSLSGAASTAGFSSIELPDLVAVVEAQLQQAIVAGRLGPGERIVEAELARQMGISRAPVREAARRLESQGLLVSRPRHGFAVRTITPKEIDDLFQVRIGLERMATGLACQQATEAQLAQLQARVDEMVAQAPRLAQAERVTLDLGIHAYLCEISGNAYLQRLFNNMQTEIRMILALTEGSYRDPALIAESHQPLVQALLRRDAQAADHALHHHLVEGQEHVQALFRPSPPAPANPPPTPP